MARAEGSGRALQQAPVFPSAYPGPVPSKACIACQPQGEDICASGGGRATGQGWPTALPLGKALTGWRTGRGEPASRQEGIM